MKATLLLVWRFEEPGKPVRTVVHDFAGFEGMSDLCREVAAYLELMGTEKALFEGVIGDLEHEILRLRAELKEAQDTLDFWLERKPVGAMS